LNIGLSIKAYDSSSSDSTFCRTVRGIGVCRRLGRVPVEIAVVITASLSDLSVNNIYYLDSTW
jgi:hypothetical protein